eukprot:2885145-Lingulodinium_polyedra.AAC.1
MVDSTMDKFGFFLQKCGRSPPSSTRRTRRGSTASSVRCAASRSGRSGPPPTARRPARPSRR